MIAQRYLLALLLTIGFAGGWYARGFPADTALAELQAAHDRQQSRLDRAAAESAQSYQEWQALLHDQLAELEAMHYEEMQDAQDRIDQLSADVAAGAVRLSVRTRAAACPAAGPVPKDSGAAGVDDGDGRAELHPGTAADLVAITRRADQCRAKLTALQAWARMVAP